MKKIIILFFMVNIMCFSNTGNQDEEENGGFIDSLTSIYKTLSTCKKYYDTAQKINFEVQYQLALMEDTQEKKVIELKKLEKYIEDLSKKDTIKLYYQLGYNNTDLSEGNDYYTKVILLNPENLDAYFGRAINKHSIGDNEGAILDFTKIIELNPAVLAAYNNRAEIYLNEKEFKLALKDLSNVIGKNKKYKFGIDITWGNYQMFKLFIKKEKLYSFFKKEEKTDGIEEIERRFKVKDGIEII